MFDIHFYGSLYRGEVAYTWSWNNDENCMQSGVSVNGRLVRVDL